MQRKRNKRRLISLIALIIMTIMVYWFAHEKSLDIVDEGIFKVEDFNTISRIVLESSTDTVNLTFNGSRWRVNDVYDADRQLIDVLFATLLQVKPKRPAAAAVRDSVSSHLEKSGVYVSLYEKETLLKKFVAGNDPQRTQTYFMESKTMTPYVMVIPGYRVNVSDIFQLDENGWRDKFVFAFNWRNLERVDVSFPNKASENFSVAMGDTYFGIEGVVSADTSRLNSFLDNVSLLTVDGYMPTDQRTVDSLRKVRAEMRIIIKDISNRQFSLSIYQAGNDKSRVIGLVHDSNRAFFAPKKIGDIIRPKSYFLRK